RVGDGGWRGEVGLTVAPKSDPPPLREPAPARTLREIFRLAVNDPRLGLVSGVLFLFIVLLGLGGPVVPWLWGRPAGGEVGSVCAGGCGGSGDAVLHRQVVPRVVGPADAADQPAPGARADRAAPGQRPHAGRGRGPGRGHGTGGDAGRQPHRPEPVHPLSRL